MITERTVRRLWEMAERCEPEVSVMSISKFDGPTKYLLYHTARLEVAAGNYYTSAKPA